MSIRKLSRTNKAIAGYEVIFCQSDLASCCVFISELIDYSCVEVKYSCSNGTAKAIVYVNDDSVIAMIEGVWFEFL